MTLASKESSITAESPTSRDRKEKSVLSRLNRASPIVLATVLAVLTLLATVATVFADGGGSPFPH